MLIMKHLKKMLAGIANLILDDDVTQIEGMASREGEIVQFRNNILLKDYPKINEWLGKIESEMRFSLASLLFDAVTELQLFYGSIETLNTSTFIPWIEKYPAQLVSLAIQVAWTNAVESSFAKSQTPDQPLVTVLHGLDILADIVLTELGPTTRRKCEHLITELVHQRDVTRSLVQNCVTNAKSFDWLYHMRYCLDLSAPTSSPMDRLQIHMADAAFPYGWEYLGVPDKLVQTPLTDRVYLTLTQALETQLGGAPFGPAGTGAYLPALVHLKGTLIIMWMQARQNLSRRLASSLGDSFSSFAVTKPLIFKPWAVSL